MDDKDKVWDRLKNGIRETDANKFHKRATRYISSEHWKNTKKRLMKEYKLNIKDV